MEDTDNRRRRADPNFSRARDRALQILGPMATNDEVSRWAHALIQPEGAADQFVARRYPRY